MKFINITLLNLNNQTRKKQIVTKKTKKLFNYKKKQFFLNFKYLKNHDSKKRRTYANDEGSQGKKLIPIFNSQWVSQIDQATFNPDDIKLFENGGFTVSDSEEEKHLVFFNFPKHFSKYFKRATLRIEKILFHQTKTQVFTKNQPNLLVFDDF